VAHKLISRPSRTSRPPWIFRLTVAFLMASLFFALHSASGAGLVIKGVIVNWNRVRAKAAESAYLQLVKVEGKMAGWTDSQGLATLTSDLPVIPVSGQGSFKVNVGQLPPGEYLIALQRALPAAPILVKHGKPAVIKVPGKSPVDLGRVKVELN